MAEICTLHVQLYLLEQIRARKAQSRSQIAFSSSYIPYCSRYASALPFQPQARNIPHFQAHQPFFTSKISITVRRPPSEIPPMPRQPPVRDDSASEPYSDELDVSSPSVLETGVDGADIAADQYESEDDGESESEGVDGQGEGLQKKLSTVSFGALAEARRAAGRSGAVPRAKRKRGAGAGSEDAAFGALRERLRELQRGGTKTAKGAGAGRGERGGARKSVLIDDESDGLDEEEASNVSRSEAGSEDEEDGEEGKKGRSKHAPAEQSSRRPVSRKRTVIALPKSTARDPRFDPLAGRLNQDGIKKKYAFLAEYQKSELAELKSTLKAKNQLSDAERESLKRKILSVESRQKAEDAKEAQKEVQRQHRKKEQELVKQGKKPFYLKKSEVKKQALVQKFEGMKGKERDRAIERRRRKLASRERRNMPDTRRA